MARLWTDPEDAALGMAYGMRVVYDSIDAVSARPGKPRNEIDGLAKCVRANGTRTQASARWWREEGCPARNLPDKNTAQGLCAAEDVDAPCGTASDHSIARPHAGFGCSPGHSPL